MVVVGLEEEGNGKATGRTRRRCYRREVSVPTCGPRLSVVEDWGVLGGLGSTGGQGKSRQGKQADTGCLAADSPDCDAASMAHQ